MVQTCIQWWKWGTCKKCRGQYVGKSTKPFKRRHSGHKQEIKNQLGGLGHHYGGAGGCGYQNVSIMIIEQVTIGDQAMLADREAYWQHQLRCYVENGGNGHCYRKEVWKSRKTLFKKKVFLEHPYVQIFMKQLPFLLSMEIYILCLFCLIVDLCWWWIVDLSETGA